MAGGIQHSICRRRSSRLVRDTSSGEREVQSGSWELQEYGKVESQIIAKSTHVL